MAHFAGRLNRWAARRRVQVAAVATVGVALFAAAAWSGGDPAGGASGEQSMVVEEAPFVVSADFSGRVAPGDAVALIAPFDATVTRLSFTYGDQVEIGQALIELDPGDVDRNRAEAEIALLRAEADVVRLANWEGGGEMRRAQRAAADAEAELGDMEARLAETRVLLDRGLVARGEYESLIQQLRQRRAAATAAREDLAETARRGQGVDLRIAGLQQQVARSRHAVAGGGHKGAVIEAPEAGVIVRPRLGNEGREEALRSGSRVSRGQSLGLIASPDSLDVVFALDEADLDAVRPGQKARVTGPGFGGQTLEGEVTGVAGEAEVAPNGSKAMFEARVRLDPLSREAARRVRIGMTALVAVVAYESPRALVIPPQAIHGAQPTTWVMTASSSEARPRRREVALGRVTPTGVEILSGLKPGDRVIWSVPPPP